ncbi:MAG: tripartite tricarboxylate transporter substrate binding protein [Alphaproteobacteria bacterium]
MKVMRYGKVVGSVSLLMGSLLVGVLGTSGSVAGSEYPNRAVTVVVPYPAGGVTDLAARALAEGMEKHLKQPVVVLNKVGGNTTIGGYAVASAKPDGYTLGYFPPAASIPEAFAYFQDAPYSSKDIKPIGGVSTPVQVVAVKEDAPWNSLKELVEYARKNPGLKVSTGGKQTVPHMFLTTLNKLEKTGFVGVPFSGDSTNLPALLGGHVSVGILEYSMLKPLVDAKKVKVFAVVTTDKRVDFAPTVPTGAELGYPGVFIPIIGLVGPRGLPEEIVEKLDSVVGKIVTEPDFQTKMRNMTLQINYQNSPNYERSLARFKDNILAFFKEEGLVKQSK